MGCDPVADSIAIDFEYFNPRTRMGCDEQPVVGFPGVLTISIHAPAWGATSTGLMVPYGFPEFQSTHPHGVRQDLGE